MPYCKPWLSSDCIPGVYYDKKDKTFRASVRVGGRKVYLGSFKSEEDAAMAYDR
jgi:hypothetical protein